LAVISIPIAITGSIRLFSIQHFLTKERQLKVYFFDFLEDMAVESRPRSPVLKYYSELQHLYSGTGSNSCHVRPEDDEYYLRLGQGMKFELKMLDCSQVD
jgi:hypothetical protein